RGDAGVDSDVVVDVDLAVQGCIAAVGVHHENVGARDGLAGPERGLGNGVGLDFASARDADGGVIASGGIGHGGDDSAAAAPSTIVSPGCDQAGHAAVRRAVPRS